MQRGLFQTHEQINGEFQGPGQGPWAKQKMKKQISQNYRKLLAELSQNSRRIIARCSNYARKKKSHTCEKIIVSDECLATNKNLAILASKSGKSHFWCMSRKKNKSRKIIANMSKIIHVYWMSRKRTILPIHAKFSQTEILAKISQHTRRILA